MQPRGATEHNEGHGDMYMTKAYVLGLTPHLRCADAGRFASAALTADGVPKRTSSLLTPPRRAASQRRLSCAPRWASPMPRSSPALLASQPPALVCKALVRAPLESTTRPQGTLCLGSEGGRVERCQHRGQRREKRSSQVK